MLQTASWLLMTWVNRWIAIACFFVVSAGGVPLRVSAATESAKRGSDELRPATNNVSIARSALGKTFLLSASVIPQEGAPTSGGLAGKIVRFELFSDGVDLYEEVDGIVVTKDLPARRLITTFPIIAQDATSLTIDFNKGMRRLFTDGWTGEGIRDQVMEVPQSRVFSVQKSDEYLVIRQSAQARDLAESANQEVRFEIRYFLSPYQPSEKPGKEPPRSEDRYVRFFETYRQLELTTGRASAKIARFDVSKPIQFYYSANTPSNYVDAVKEGILYWNRAFGTNIVRADKAPDGVTAPDARYNVIQWVPWDAAGFAYADVLLDPLTGESKHGQVYMTSVFAISGRARARALLRMMSELAAEKKSDKKDGEPKKHPPALPKLPFFEQTSACRMDTQAMAAEMAQGLQDLLANENLTDEAVLRVSRDYVRSVVAHEVGHVLGLRHNFAGSLATTLPQTDLDEWFKSYLIHTNYQSFSNRISSSSVMEYSVFKPTVFEGWMIGSSTNALPYDRAAIQWGYFDSKDPVSQKLLFATDEDVFRFGDALRFDYGTEPVVAGYAEIASLVHELPNYLIENFISARAPQDPRDRVPLEEVNLSPGLYAGAIAADISHMLYWFRSGARSLRLENDFGFIGALNKKDRTVAHWKSLNEQIEHLGGIDRTFFGTLPLDLKIDTKGEQKGVSAADKINAGTLSSRLEKLLEAPAYTNFVGLDEKHYSFTKEEKELIVKRGRKFFEEFEKETVKRVCKSFEDAPRDLGTEANDHLEDDDVVAKLETKIVEMARTVVLATDDSKRLKGKVDKSFVEVVKFKYDQETRLAAAKMLNDKTGSFRAWSIEAKSDLNKALKDQVEGALNIANLKDFKESSLSLPLREWYLEQQDVLGLLPPKPGR
ncbi:MAG TPA: zinc-dependent metalloprotease [Candidatus Limnocylindria bacterium]|nr:zinc-dependent metalloprotease [Candidatus Limnocylindria bacterium]